MIKLFKIFILTLTVFTSKAQITDTVSILFIGNSFTYYNDLPLMVQQLALGAGKKVVIGSHTPGGISVGDISQGTNAHMNNPIVFDLIKKNKWDYLLLQDNQGRFLLNYGVFPNSSLVVKGHKKIRDSLLFYNPCAHILWFAGWGPKNGYLPYASTGSGLIDRIYNNYTYLQDSLGQVISPIGKAWERVIGIDSAIELWDADLTHPGLNGTYLAANVIYSTIFKSNPMASTYVPLGITFFNDSLFKSIAFHTVMDSINVTGLSTITPTIMQVGNTLTVTGYVTCSWFRNDTFLISNTGTYIIKNAGRYFAKGVDVNGCEYRTNEINIESPLNSNELNTVDNKLKLYPNPSLDGIFFISSVEEYQQIRIFNSYGSILENNKANTTIDLSKYNKGMFFIEAITKSGKIKMAQVIYQ